MLIDNFDVNWYTIHFSKKWLVTSSWDACYNLKREHPKMVEERFCLWKILSNEVKIPYLPWHSNYHYGDYIRTKWRINKNIEPRAEDERNIIDVCNREGLLMKRIGLYSVGVEYAEKTEK